MSSEAQVAEAEQQTQPSEVNTTQETTADWKSSLPEEIRSDKSLESINDIAALAKSYIHAQKMVGVDKIPLPNKLATDEDWQQVYSKLGRPDKPEGYEFKIDENVKVDNATLDAYKNFAHANGLLPKQAQGLLDFYNNMTSKAFQEQNSVTQAAREQAEASLKTEWGKAFESKVQNASKTAVKYIGEDFAHLILNDGTKVGDHPAFVKAFDKISMDLGEDTVVSGNGPQYMTPREIDKQLAELQRPGSAFWDKNHPNHGIAVQEVQNLMEQKYPSST